MAAKMTMLNNSRSEDMETLKSDLEADTKKRNRSLNSLRARIERYFN